MPTLGKSSDLRLRLALNNIGYFSIPVVGGGVVGSFCFFDDLPVKSAGDLLRI